MSLANDQFATSREHLRFIREQSEKEFNFRFSERMAIDSERASVAWNKISNAVTLGFGQGLVRAGASLDNILGKSDSLARVAETVGRIAAGGATEVVRRLG